MNKFFKCLAALVAAIVGGLASLQAAVPQEITDIVDDATSLFDSVTAIVVAIVAFGILIFIVRKVRGR